LEPTLTAMPRELQQLFLLACARLSPAAGHVISFATSSSFDYAEREIGTESPVASFPASFLVHAAARISHGLTCLNVDSLSVHDDFLMALSTSSAAPTLRILSAKNNFITDRSSPAWGAFSSLEKLILSEFSYLGEATLAALARLPELRVLQCEKPYAMTIDSLLETMLGVGAMPKMTNLAISNVQEVQTSLEQILALLEKRTNLESIESLSIGHSGPGSTDVFKRIHTLCPNLQTVHFRGKTPINLLAPEYASILPNLSNIRVASTRLIFRDADPAGFATKLADLFPRLESLVLFNHVVTDFSMFASLKSLNYTCEERFVNVEKWPPGLENLSIEFASDNMSPAALDSFISTMCASCKQLQYTMLSLPLKRHHVQMLLDSLPNLGAFAINKPIQNADGPMKISHPSLRGLPDAVEAAVPGYLPSIKSLWIMSGHSVWQSVTNKELPSLRCVRWNSIGSGAEKAPTPFMQNVVSEIPRFSELVLNCRFENSLLDTIRTMTHLHTLDLVCKPLQWQDAKSLVQCLPWLVDLRLEVASSNDFTFSWLSHPRLAELKVIVNDALPDFVELAISPSTLPSLQHLHTLLASRSKLISYKFSDLKSLKSVSLESASSKQPCHVEFNQCPHVLSFSMSWAWIERLKLMDTDHLIEIDFDNFGVGAELALSDVSTSMNAIRVFKYCMRSVPESPQARALLAHLSAAVRPEVRDGPNWTTDLPNETV
jgi:hypothetical protein